MIYCFGVFDSSAWHARVNVSAYHLALHLDRPSMTSTEATGKAYELAQGRCLSHVMNVTEWPREGQPWSMLWRLQGIPGKVVF